MRRPAPFTVMAAAAQLADMSGRPGAHTRCDSIENALRDDLAQTRRLLGQRNREMASLKRQVAQLKAELRAARAQTQSRFSTGLDALCRALCCCCGRPPIAQQLLREHTAQELGQRDSHKYPAAGTSELETYSSSEEVVT